MNIEQLQRLAVDIVDDACASVDRIIGQVDRVKFTARDALEHVRMFAVHLILQGKPETPCEHCHTKEAQFGGLCAACDFARFNEVFQRGTKP